MNKPAGELAQRKELLLARSAVYRLSLAMEIVTLRESLSMRRIATSVPKGPLLLAGLAFLAGRSRLARLVGWATKALMVVKLARSVRELATQRRR